MRQISVTVMNAVVDTSQSAVRRDSFELLKAPYKNSYGKWIVEGIVARPGIYEYTNSDGSPRFELITAEALSRKAWLEDLQGVPVVIEHPEHEVMPEDTAQLRVGTCLEAKMIDGCAVWAKLIIDTPEGIDFLIKRRVRGLSPHYYASTEPESGRHPLYGKHDSIQVHRERPNHIALTQSPRGGHKTSVRLDSYMTGEKMELLKSTLMAAGLDEAKVAEIVAALQAKMGQAPEVEVEVKAEEVAEAPAMDMSAYDDKLAALDTRMSALEDMLAKKDAEGAEASEDMEEAKDSKGSKSDTSATEDSKSTEETKTETYKAAELTTDSASAVQLTSLIRTLDNL